MLDMPYYPKKDFDVFKYKNHVYVLFDKGTNKDTTGGLFQGLIKAYYREFKLKKVTI